MSTSIIVGDALEVLCRLPDELFNCAVTSPPYWGLRDYGVAGQIGLEPSLSEHLDRLVRVFREVRRVLRNDGTLWINYGDAYASSPNGRSAADTKAAGNDDRTFRDKPISTVGPIYPPGPGQPFPLGIGRRGGGNGRDAMLKAKDRMLLPARLAIALQEDGWYVRDEIIWHKPNPMPSSVKDRTTPAHEMIYMLSKRPRYYYDQDAILEEASSSSKQRLAQDVDAQAGSLRANGGVRADRPMKAVARKRGVPPRHAQYAESSDRRELDDAARGMPRNKRSVWTIPPKGFKEAHFATFPPDLIEPCILAGCPVGGTVLDPFFGAGTTGLVAQQNNRNSVGIELNPAYAEIARCRIGGPVAVHHIAAKEAAE